MTRDLVHYGSVWHREVGNFTDDYSLLTVEETGLGENSLVAPDTTTIFGRNADGKFTELAVIDEAPGDNDTITVDFFGQYDQIHALEQYHIAQREFHLQRLFFATPPLDVRSLAKKVETWRAKITDGTQGSGPNRDGAGGLRENSMTLSLSERVVLNLGTALSNVTNSATEDAQSIFMFTRDFDRSTGYRGPDKVIYVGLNDVPATSPGKVMVSTNGGGTFADITTDPTPFTENQGVDNIIGKVINETQHRLIVSREADSGAKAMFAYGDFTFQSESDDPGWTVVTIAATANNEAVESMLWMRGLSRIYIAAAGDIYLSTDLGETDPGTAIYTGANAINEFHQDFENNVWAVGASDTILVELSNDRGSFTAKTGPNDGAIHSIVRAKDGTIYAGVGTKIYRNTNEAATTGGWTSMKDFGANHQVNKIFIPNGNSQVIYAVVHDGTGNDGDLWFSTNGGVTWTEKTDLTNNGYNDAVISEEDPNKMFLAGPINTNPIIHKLS